MLLEVNLLTPGNILFSGKANRVILPGEQGVFEILMHHKPLISRLISGRVMIDRKEFPIKRGIVKINQNRVTIVAE